MKKRFLALKRRAEPWNSGFNFYMTIMFTGLQYLKINNPKLLNKKNYSDAGVNHRFSRKITQIRGTIDKKRQKEAFVRGTMNGKRKKEAFYHGENQNSAKNGFPNIGKNKKCHWLHFPTLGKTKNPESLLSDFRGSVHFNTSSFKFSNAY